MYVPSVNSAIEPLRQKTSLLLAFDGADGATTFTDASTFARPITRVGSAQVDTDQSVFGGASLLLNGSTDYLSIPTHSSMNMRREDFTIQARIRPAALTNNYSTILAGGYSYNSSSNRGLMVYGSGRGADAYKLALSGNGTYSYNAFLKSTTLLSAGNWYVIALTRQGNTLRLFINGTLEASLTSTATMDFSLAQTLIGANYWDGTAGRFNGHLDDLHVIKGVCLYTANYTPSSEPAALLA